MDIDIEDEPIIDLKPRPIEVKQEIIPAKETPVPKQTPSLPENTRTNDLDLLDISESTRKDLTTLEVPKFELILERNSIGDVEKAINNEFFEGRPTKTPTRYLKVKIRILSFSNFYKNSNFRYEIIY